MGRLILINKIKTDTTKYYYCVNSSSLKQTFFLSVNPVSKIILFHLNEDFLSSIASFDTRNLKQRLVIPELAPSVYLPALRKIYDALQKNDFPQTLHIT